MNKVLPAFVLCAVTAMAHDIPANVAAHAFVRANGNTFQVLVRVPLAAIRDVQFPEYRSGYLDLEKLAPMLPGAVKVQIADLMEIRERQRVLPAPRISATQISLESDRSFTSFEDALRRVHAPMLPNTANVVWNQVFLDALLEYPIESGQSDFFIHPGFHRLAETVLTVLRFVTPGGEVRVYEFTGDPGLVPLDPRWHQAARHFVVMGFWHILDGLDHLLFLLCLVIPLRNLRVLVGVVTGFTAAHSFTLIASAMGLAPDRLWFPPLVETLIAASIVYMALENIAVAGSRQHRWIVAFVFGLVHGFGFSFALRESLQLAGSHLLTSLVAFNVGVEIGQVLVLLILIPLLQLFFRYVMAERMGTIILSAIVAHTGWHWMTERAAHLQRFF